MKMRMLATAAALLLGGTVASHAADKVKFDMWHGLPGEPAEAAG